jgi:hypothetical protein
MVTHQLALSPAIANFFHYKLRTIEPPAYESPRIVEFIRDEIAAPLKACVSHETGAPAIRLPRIARLRQCPSQGHPADNLRL